MKTRQYISHMTFLLIIITVFSSALPAADGQDRSESFMNCFAISAGKDATIDGSVMLAHNEDDWGERVVNFYKVPRLAQAEQGKIRLKNGGLVNPADETCEFLWLEMPELEFSDSFLNEHGVTVTSNACPSREDKPELTDGGIGYFLRRIMAERGRTAREAVAIGGRLVEAWGYSQPGRTYSVADPNEAWLLAVVHGKHWVAQRVPDAHVAVIPNYYTIGAIDLSDKLNFLGSADIVDYAIKRGWYDPARDGEFSFRKAYSMPDTLTHRGNLSRHWRGINLLSEKQYAVDEAFPFSFEPREKVTLSHLMNLLRDHHEGTAHELVDGKRLPDPHKNRFSTICSATTQYGFVAQLRRDMPVEVGAVMWLAPKRPCIQYYVPWYCGITKIPQGFANNDHVHALAHHFEPPKGLPPRINTAFPALSGYANEMDACYREKQEAVQKARDEDEKHLLAKQAEFEKRVLQVYANDRAAALEMITDYTEHHALGQVLRVNSSALLGTGSR